MLHRVLALPLLAVILLGMFWVSICLVGGWAEGASQTLWQGSWTFLGREHLGVVPLLAYGLEKLSCAPWLTALLVDGVAAGVGAVLVFLPQLATLFLCLTFLEGCGYLSRGAYLLDRGGAAGLACRGNRWCPMCSPAAAGCRASWPAGPSAGPAAGG